MDNKTRYSNKDIIRKVKGLLRLADHERNPAEHEVARALKLAKKLIRKYNLSMTEVETKEENDNVGEFILSQKAFATWEHILVRVICRMLDIEFFFSSRVEPNNDPRAKRSHRLRRRIVFLGSPRDCALAIEMFHLFKKEMRTLYRKARKNSPDLVMNHYCQGLAMYMEKEIQRIKAEEVAEKSNQATSYGALVVVKKDAIRHYKEKNLNLQSRKRHSLSLNSDVLNGYADGPSVNLDVPKCGIK